MQEFRIDITFAPCCSQVVSTLRNRSSRRLPQSLRVPCVAFQGGSGELHHDEDRDLFSSGVERSGGFLVETVFEQRANVQFRSALVHRPLLYSNSAIRETSVFTAIEHHSAEVLRMLKLPNYSFRRAPTSTSKQPAMAARRSIRLIGHEPTKPP